MSNGSRFYDMAVKSEAAEKGAGRAASHSTGKGPSSGDLTSASMPPAAPNDKGGPQYQLSPEEARRPYAADGRFPPASPSLRWMNNRPACIAAARLM